MPIRVVTRWPTHPIVNGNKICNRCKLIFPIIKFNRHGKGWYSICKACANTTRRARYKRDATFRDKIREYGKNNWRRLYVKKTDNKADYPRTKHCEICSKTGTVVFDHNHITGKFRGWLCIKCNSGIGLLGDSYFIVSNALRYLAERNACTY